MQREVQLDVSVNLAAFFLKNIGLWMSDDPGYERRRKVILVYTMWCIMLSSVVISRDVYFTWLYDGVSIFIFDENIILFIFTYCIRGYSLRCYQCFEHDDDSSEDMHDSDTQRGIYQSDRVHARKFLERQLRFPREGDFGKLQENLRLLRLLGYDDWNMRYTVLSGHTAHR